MESVQSLIAESTHMASFIPDRSHSTFWQCGTNKFSPWIHPCSWPAGLGWAWSGVCPVQHWKSFFLMAWKVLTTGTSLSDWEEILNSLKWSSEEALLPVNVLQLKAIQLTLQRWTSLLGGLPVRVQSDQRRAHSDLVSGAVDVWILESGLSNQKYFRLYRIVTRIWDPQAFTVDALLTLWDTVNLIYAFLPLKFLPRLPWRIEKKGVPMIFMAPSFPRSAW